MLYNDLRNSFLLAFLYLYFTPHFSKRKLNA